jgi:hypothetical protein
MKILAVVAFIAVSTLTTVSAQAQNVGVYGEVGVSVRQMQTTGNYATGNGYPPVGVTGHGRPVRRDCEQGFRMNSRGECIEMHEPRLVERAACTPGETRRVPDPARPGGFRIHECGTID